MLEEIQKRLSDYKIISIKKDNFEQAFEVYDTNQNFFLLTQGSKATMESSVNDIDALPPNCDMEQKIYVCICEQDKIIAVMDLIMEFPEKSVFWIGLLLIHGDMQGKKIGSKIVTAVLDAAKSAGYRTAQLGVIENNVMAIKFWQRHGFERFGQSDNIVVMARQIV